VLGSAVHTKGWGWELVFDEAVDDDLEVGDGGETLRLRRRLMSLAKKPSTDLWIFLRLGI
jgi:hypothetical protein